MISKLFNGSDQFYFETFDPDLQFMDKTANILLRLSFLETPGGSILSFSSVDTTRKRPLQRWCMVGPLYPRQAQISSSMRRNHHNVTIKNGFLHCYVIT